MHSTDDILDDISSLQSKLNLAKQEIAQQFIGQEHVVDLALTTLLSGGHGLLTGLPGLGKTQLVSTLSAVMGLDGKRVQFTPDLMPSDILGSEVLDIAPSGERSFRFIKGPIFCQMLMADEINRASPRTQSALLQAMQESEVTLSGKTYPLSKPFHVFATQNPIDQEGTYPLPEAQLDRFLLQITLDYPNEDTERAILTATTGIMQNQASAVFTAQTLKDAQTLIRTLPMGDSLITFILALTREGRPQSTTLPFIQDYVEWGPSPRAAQALMLTSRAYALLQGRLAPSIDDIKKMAYPVLAHRMARTFKANQDGVTLDAIIEHLTANAEAGISQYDEKCIGQS